MELLHLPEEILAIIFGYLDLKAKLHLYHTCSITRRIVCASNMCKYFNLSLSSLATVATLKTDYIKSMSPFIQELNLCGVTNLTKTNLLPCLKRMTQLKHLNVAYTDIIIPDLIDKKLHFTQLKSIEINFILTKKNIPNVSNSVLASCINFFKDFDRVHFVGCVENVLYSRIALYVLSQTKDTVIVEMTGLKTFNSAIYSFPVDHEYSIDNFYHLSYSFPHWVGDMSQFNLDIQLFTEKTQLKNLEYIIILHEKYEKKVLSSNRFIALFDKHFGIKTNYVNLTNIIHCRGNSLFLFWNKKKLDNTNILDNTFCNKLILKLKDYFPIYPSLYINFKNIYTDWYYMAASDSSQKYLPANNTSSVVCTSAKKVRRTENEYILDYDSIFRNNEHIKLKLYINHKCRNTSAIYDLPIKADYLGKITVLSLILESYTLLNHNFFSTLCKSCTNLLTLNVENLAYQPQLSNSLANSIHLSKNLRNLRLIGNTIDHAILLPKLANCNNFVNVYIKDVSNYYSNTITMSHLDMLVNNSVDLYSLYLYSNISDTQRLSLMRSVNKLKTVNHKEYLKIQINNKNCKCDSFDPIIGIFPVTIS